MPYELISMRSFTNVGLHLRRHSERSEESSVALRAAFCIGWILRFTQDDKQLLAIYEYVIIQLQYKGRHWILRYAQDDVECSYQIS